MAGASHSSTPRRPGSQRYNHQLGQGIDFFPSPNCMLTSTRKEKEETLQLHIHFKGATFQKRNTK